MLFAFKFTSPLRDVSGTSATYQLSTCRKWYVHHSKHSMIILVTKPISITPVLSLARKASNKVLPVKTITQGKSKPLVENMFSYQSSYWGMSTLAVPVLLQQDLWRYPSGNKWDSKTVAKRIFLDTIHVLKNKHQFKVSCLWPLPIGFARLGLAAQRGKELDDR